MTLDSSVPVATIDPPPPPPFRAKQAFLSLGLVLLAQIVVGIVVGLFVFAWKSGEANPEKAATRAMGAPLLLGAGLASVAATLLAARLWGGSLLRNRTPSGLGLFLPDFRVLLAAALLGAALSGGYVALTSLLPPAPDSTHGFIVETAMQGGLGRLSWAIVALLCAPLYEEILFRGLVLKGFQESWGTWPAGIAVTVIFVALHLTEIRSYWPAAFGVGSMAIVALLARLRTGSVMTSMAVHAAYNFVIVVFVYLSD